MEEVPTRRYPDAPCSLTSSCALFRAKQSRQHPFSAKISMSRLLRAIQLLLADEQEYKSGLSQHVLDDIRFGVAALHQRHKQFHQGRGILIGRAFNKKTGARRRLLNRPLAEYRPVDPFSDTPSRRISLSELLEANYVQSAYRNVTRPTFHRELMRLGERSSSSLETSRFRTGSWSWILGRDARSAAESS